MTVVLPIVLSRDRVGWPRIRYCMDLPSFALASVELDAVTSARASTDNFPSAEDGPHAHWRWKIGYGSLLYSVLGLQSFMDVIWTNAVQPGNVANHGLPSNRTNIELQATVAALASGPVGLGDGPALTNATLAMKLCREDGRLLHPSRPATPIDKMFHLSVRPTGESTEVWSALSLIPGGHDRAAPGKWWMVLAVDLSEEFALEVADLSGVDATEIEEELIAWQLQDPRCMDGAPPTSCLHAFGSSRGTTQQRQRQRRPNATLSLSTHGASPRAFSEHHWATWSVGRRCNSGWALLGERHKIVAVSPARFARVQCIEGSATTSAGGAPRGGGLQLGLVGAPEEAVELLIVAPDRLKAVVVKLGLLGTATLWCTGVEGAGHACKQHTY
eukprot:COSAG01_NODE_3731_length_5755_cov_6.626414_5_plen_387_part_00